MDQSKCFEGLKVVELANVLAGPAVGMFFAELGAEVIKIENKTTGGDMTRKWKLPEEDKDSPISAYYCSVNWNKEVKLLNLKEKKDQAIVHDLIRESDIVITNYKPGKSEELKMDYHTLKNINPGLIYAHISGFGEDSTRTAFDVVLQAETGFMSMNGQPDGPPTKMPVALIDILAAHQLKEGILVGLIQRLKTGKGSYISASLFDSTIASLANQATNWLMAKHNPTRLGSIHPNIAPYGEIIETIDNQQVVLAIGTDKQFKALCKIIGRDELAKNKDFSTNGNRVINRKKLHIELIKSMKLFSADSLLSNLIKNDVPCGIINTISDVFNSPAATKTVLKEVIETVPTSRVKTVAFTIKTDF
ncbi:MAG: CoA transferase [Flavobacteriales bacterium]|nr:CoA transferase [Flavobacteriales bacterium]